MSINRVVVTGNLCADPDVKALPSGQSVMELRLAVNERRKNPQSGAWEDAPNFVDVSMFGERAPKLAEYLHKGSKVGVDGRLHEDTWQDKNTGQKRSKLRIIANEIELLTPKGERKQEKPTEDDEDDLPMPDWMKG